MTLFQLFDTLFQNEIIGKDVYLDRLKELKVSKEKELEEIIKAMESVQPDKTKASNNNDLGPKYSVGDVLYTNNNSEARLNILLPSVIMSIAPISLMGLLLVGAPLFDKNGEKILDKQEGIVMSHGHQMFLLRKIFQKKKKKMLHSSKK